MMIRTEMLQKTERKKKKACHSMEGFLRALYHVFHQSLAYRLFVKLAIRFLVSSAVFEENVEVLS